MSRCNHFRCFTPEKNLIPIIFFLLLTFGSNPTCYVNANTNGGGWLGGLLSGGGEKKSSDDIEKDRVNTNNPQRTLQNIPPPPPSLSGLSPMNQRYRQSQPPPPPSFVNQQEVPSNRLANQNNQTKTQNGDEKRERDTGNSRTMIKDAMASAGYLTDADGFALPPPPPPISDNEDEVDELKEEEQKPQLQKQVPVEGSYNIWGTPSTFGMIPPPQGYNDWQMQQMLMAQQQQQQQYQQEWQDHHKNQVGKDMREQSDNYYLGQQNEDAIIALQVELDSALAHRNDLYSEVQNMTAILREMEIQSDIQYSEIDALIEKVADAEAHASAESNAALEYKANCTALAQTIDYLQEDIQNWNNKCNDLIHSRECDLEEMNEIKGKLAEREAELEKMACGIEIERVKRERSKYLEEIQRKRKAQKSKNGLLWNLFFGWMSNEEYNDSEEEDASLEELARSTLLQALQIERNNVEELELQVSTLQQNNSAISEMVSSRDSLIDELNGRVEVFEEDKMVLKAALRQLQKEMKEEAPKTQKLVDDLKVAKKEMAELISDIESLQNSHAKDIEGYKLQLKEKGNIINETDSKISMISIYVDQLEERLASFALARRDIELREEKCNDLEEKAVENEEEMLSIREREDLTNKENIELKNLTEMLIKERSVLQKDKNLLETKVGTLRQIEQNNTQIIRELSRKLSEMNSTIGILDESVRDLESNLSHKEAEIDLLQTENSKAESKMKYQEETIRNLEEDRQTVETKLGEVLADNAEAHAAISQYEEELVLMREEIYDLQASLNDLNEKYKAAECIMQAYDDYRELEDKEDLDNNLPELFDNSDEITEGDGLLTNKEENIADIVESRVDNGESIALSGTEIYPNSNLEMSNMNTLKDEFTQSSEPKQKTDFSIENYTENENDPPNLFSSTQVRSMHISEHLSDKEDEVGKEDTILKVDKDLLSVKAGTDSDSIDMKQPLNVPTLPRSKRTVKDHSRKVPFRSIRKTCSRITGKHRFFGQKNK